VKFRERTKNPPFHPNFYTLSIFSYIVEEEIKGKVNAFLST
jgi:hypothetical protein